VEGKKRAHMSNLLPDIDFLRIRPFQNSRNKGFEELSVQLFRATFTDKTEFYRVDDKGGDGGVEDIAIISENEKVGMQAKYFTSLDQSQWSQINNSVRTAIQTHAPDLIEYRIYTPQNRSKKTETWENYKRKWNEFARSKNGYILDIKFCWEGETELRTELIKEEHREKLQYWFNFPSFCFEWLMKEFNKSKAAIDTRYTPKLHIRTYVESQLNAFCLNQKFKDILVEHFEKLKYNITELLDRLNELPVEQKDNIGNGREFINSIFRNAISVPSFESLHSICINIEEVLDSAREYYYKLQKDHPKYNTNSYSGNPYDYELLLLRKSIKNCTSALSFISSFQVYDKQFLLLQGEAGTGKSHVMTNLAENCLKREQSSLLFVGEHFISGDPPHQQIKNIIEWEGSFHALLQLLEQDARVKQKPSLILIDALNECGNKKIWKNHLLSLIEEMKNFPNVRLLISCRSDFSQFVLPESLSKSENHYFGYIEHHGFDLNFSEAVETYFKGYGIRSDHFPPLIEEFRNPLFLKTFCEAFAGRKIPGGPLGLDSVMEARIDQCRKEVINRIDCPEYIINEAIEFISKEIQKNNGIGIHQEKVQRKMDELYPTSGVSTSLYTSLKSNGFIIETYIRGELIVRFPYERFSDYLIAKRILNKSKVRDLKRGWRKNGRLFQEYLADPFKYRNLLRMFAILVPEKYQIDLINLVKEPTYMQTLGKIPLLKRLIKKEIPDSTSYYLDFWEALVWRSRKSITEATTVLVGECVSLIDSDVILNGLFKMVTIPDHPYNAICLHSYLKKLSLSQLEYKWTIPVSNITEYSSSSIESLIDWIFNVSPNQVDNKQAWLAALALTWLLSSNNRGLRKRVSLALIKLLLGRTELVVKLIEEFHDCVDPYIQERIYATACGVVLRESNKNRIELLTSVVYKYVFSGESVPPNILIRDYAFTIMEYGKYKQALAPEVDFKKINPPYRSNWTGFSKGNDLEDRYRRDGWDTIRASLQPEKSGWYGDFGRYVMEAAVHRFSNQRLNETYTPGKKYENILDGADTGNFIFNRVRELGWCPELFGEYEKTLRSGRLRVDEEERKVERISKKYQWIGLYELLGHLADNYWLHPDYEDDEPRVCHGAEPFFIREFDPSQPLVDPNTKFSLNEDDKNEDFELSDVKINPLDNNFSDEFLLLDRKAWVESPPKDFSSLIEMKKIDKSDWLLLAGHFYQEEKLKIYQDESIVGRNKLWVDIRCWLIEKEYLNLFIAYIKNVKFHGSGVGHIELQNSWLGEYPWTNDCQWIREACTVSPEWVRGCSIDILTTECEYRKEGSSQQGFLPSPQVIDFLDLHWSGEGFDYLNKYGEKICTSIGDNKEGEPYLYIRKDILLKKIKEAGYIPVWAGLSEKSCYSYKASKSIVLKWAVTQRIYGERENCIYKIEDKKYDIPLYR
jgi:hypothetical protein